MKQILVILTFFIVSCAGGKGPGIADRTDETSSGEIDQRIKMVTDRIMFGQTPQMSADFILSDISLKPEFKRRFTAFSGDISGRYFDVFSAYPSENNPINMAELMDEALTYQHPDGRFGNPDLLFDPEKLASPHMALLWGNGRLLVGMMKYYQMDRQPKVLAAAKKLGDFINGIASSCANQEVANRLKDNSYMGYICFTQLMEGLVLLSDETRDEKYMQNGDQIDVSVEYHVKWVDSEKKEIAFPIAGKMQAALFYGPYLMSVDGNFQPFFDSEPSLTNYLVLQDELKFGPETAPSGSNLKNTYLVMQHVHTDMFGKYPVVMRPISETTWQSACKTRVWFTVSQ